MNNFLRVLYIKRYLFFRWCVNTAKLIRFIYFVYKKNIFRDGNPELILEILRGFLKQEYINYTECLVQGRTTEESYTLLSALIDEYYDSKSEVTLNQILEVLKEEFIKRRK